MVHGLNMQYSNVQVVEMCYSLLVIGREAAVDNAVSFVD